MLSASATVDPNIDTLSPIVAVVADLAGIRDEASAGRCSGAIYQIARVFRLESRTPAQSRIYSARMVSARVDYRQLMRRCRQLLIEAGIGSDSLYRSPIAMLSAARASIRLRKSGAIAASLCDAIGPAPNHRGGAGRTGVTSGSTC